MAITRTQHPSGEQYEIFFGDQRAVVTEVGATLREYAVGGRPVVDGFASSEMCSGGRGQVLMPWPNRIRDGAYEFGGHKLQLPLSEPERHNASHGLVRWAVWRRLEQGQDRVRLGLTLHPQPGYPFLLELAVEYALGAGGLRTTCSAHNLGPEPAPFGAGCHPYLRPRAGLVDGAELWIPAGAYLDLDERLIPTGRRLPVAGTRYDFREPRPVGETVFDLCFTEFVEPWAEFDGVRLSWDANHSYLQVYSGDGLPPDRRRHGLALEPMSCPVDAFNSGEALIALSPGDYWSGSWSLSALAL
jgi:galactose mutarotase-like enzyme